MAIITISRGTMSGGQALAQCLSESLGFPAVSQEIIAEASRRSGVSQALLQEQMEQTRGLVHGLSSKRRRYLTAVQLALAERAQRGPLIYYGHAGHLLLQGLPQVLKVRVIAPLRLRALKMAERQKITPEEARKAIEKMDEGRVKWTRFLYNVDWRDPELYDLVVKLDVLTLESACALIVCALDRPEFVPAPDTRARVDDFILASRVKYALAAEDQTKGLELKVDAAGGVVRISGSFETGGLFPSGRRRIQEDLKEVAGQVPGVAQVQIDLEDVRVALE